MAEEWADSGTTGAHVRPPASEAEWAAYYELRWRMLRAPLAQPRGSERDEREGVAVHRAFFDQAGTLRGVGRLHFNGPEEAQVRYMAVDPGWRRRGAGARVLAALEEAARAGGASRIVLNARDEAAPFYLRHGYAARGPAETLLGVVRHTRMEKELAPGGFRPAG